LLSEHQFGFRKNKSTSLAVLKYIENTIQAFEMGCDTLSIFYDLEKAFDCVDHALMAKKLCKYGFSEASSSLIRSYLSNRQQQVRFGGSVSKCLPVKYGVPQGSILGPILFLIFINDIDLLSPLSQIILYADDTTISVTRETYEEVCRAGDVIANEVLCWFSSNRLSVNDSKLKKMLLSLKRTEAEPNFVPSAKLLGIIVDPKLSWDAHGSYIEDKLSAQLFLMRRLKNNLPEHLLRDVYHGLIHSLLTYGILTWGHSCIMKRLFKWQRKAVRLVGSLGFREDCRIVFKNKRILTLPSVYILESILYVHTHNEDYSTRGVGHNYSTRNKAQLNVGFIKRNRCQISSNYWGIKFHNKLPKGMLNLSPGALKSKLKTILLDCVCYDFDEFLSFVF